VIFAPGKITMNAALDLAAAGLPVFPCAISTKRPTVPHGFKAASRDPTIIKKLWRDHPGGLIGVPTGEISGFDVVDLDAKHAQAREWFARNRSRLPKTRAYRSRSGGIHFAFAHHDQMRCSAAQPAPGVDVRADGGYVIAWWALGFPILCDAPPAPWPDWLLAELKPKPQPQSNRPTVRVPDNYFLAELVRLVAGAREGERNSLTFWCACRAGEMVASGLLSAGAAIAVIAEAATRSGLSRKEAERTARSGVKTGGGQC